VWIPGSLVGGLEYVWLLCNLFVVVVSSMSGYFVICLWLLPES
jgi:hypothetical protein